MRGVGTLSKGSKWIGIQNLEAVAKFVGLNGTGHEPLPPDVLFARLLKILSTAQSCVRQVPDDKLREDAIHNRKRDLRMLSHHIFRIVEAYLEVENDFPRDSTVKALADGSFTSSEQIARYGGEVLARLQPWWASLEDKSCGREINTYYGKTTLHRLFERTTWHSAQHTRQLISVLEGFGITLDQKFSEADLAGLPLPERLWE